MREPAAPPRRQVAQDGSAGYSHLVADLARAHPRDVRRLFRSRELSEVTSGLCLGYLQANLVVLTCVDARSIRSRFETSDLRPDESTTNIGLFKAGQASCPSRSTSCR